MLDVDHVAAELADQRQQRGQRTRPVDDLDPQRQEAPRGHQAVLGDVQQHQRVDVAAGQHRDHGRREQLRVRHDRRHRGHPGRLDDELRAFQAQQHRLRQLILRHRDDLVDQLG